MTAILTHSCPPESPGELLKNSHSEPHTRPFNSDSLGIGILTSIDFKSSSGDCSVQLELRTVLTLSCRQWGNRALSKRQHDILEWCIRVWKIDGEGTRQDNIGPTPREQSQEHTKFYLSLSLIIIYFINIIICYSHYFTFLEEMRFHQRHLTSLSARFVFASASYLEHHIPDSTLNCLLKVFEPLW